MPTLGLSMIVKNGAKSLRSCLESVRGVVSEIVIADTGSTDGSLEIARESGAVVFSIPWENDFARARNAALEKMTTRWVLVLDADEELDARARHSLPKLLRAPKVGGYIMPVRNYLPLRHGSVNGSRAVANDGRNPRAADAPSYAEHTVVRLFRNHPQVRFSGCIHEAVGPQIAALGLAMPQISLCIHHFGYLASKADHEKKAELYLQLLRAKVEQQPANPLAWMELAHQLHEPFHRNQEALECLDRALALDPHLAGAWFLAGSAFLELQRDQEALVALDRAALEGALPAENEHARGDALHNLGRFPEARDAYRRVLEVAGDDPQVESKLGYTEVRIGEIDSGLARMRSAIIAMPCAAEFHERLIKSCLVANRMEEAALAAEQFAEIVRHPKTYLRAAAIRASMQQHSQAHSLILRGLETFPESAELRCAAAELALQAHAGAAARG